MDAISILERCVLDGDEVVTLEKIKNEENYMNTIQFSQFYRRATLCSRINALKIMRRPYPHYSKEALKKYGRNVSVKEKVSAFLGTCKRLLKGNL